MHSVNCSLFSLDRGQTFPVTRESNCSFIYGQLLTLATVGAYQVISGWEEGLLGMCEGEKRTLTIPPTKAYGTFFMYIR